MPLNIPASWFTNSPSNRYRSLDSHEESTHIYSSQHNFVRTYVDFISERKKLEEPIDLTKWTDSRGETKPLTELADEHLINIFNKIRRLDNWKRNYLEPIRDEIKRRNQLKRRTEMATLETIQNKVSKMPEEVTTLKAKITELETLISSFEVPLGDIVDNLISAEAILEEETMDDVVFIGENKTKAKELLEKINKWKTSDE